MYSIIEKHFIHNRGGLVKRATFRLGNKEDAEDAVQEAYCRALKYSHTFEMGMHFNHWFQRILSNVMKDIISAKFERGHEEELEEDVVAANTQSNYTKRLLAIIEKEVSLVEDEDEREALEMYFLHGMKLGEVNQLSPLTYRTINYLVGDFKRKLRTRE